jgi:hypothetical protein
LQGFYARQRRFLRAAQDFGVAEIADEETGEPSLIAIQFCNFSALAVFCQQELNTTTLARRTHMENLTTKLAALAGTLFMNALVMGAVAYCFALQPNTYMTAVALAKAVATQQGLG